MVIVPSVWSVPIEGALMKSMMHANRVIAIESTYENNEKDFTTIDYINLDSENLERDIIEISQGKSKREEMVKELNEKITEWSKNLEILNE